MMNDKVKIAIILAVAIITATAIYVFFSPYQSCVRNYTKTPNNIPEVICARITSGKGY